MAASGKGNGNGRRSGKQAVFCGIAAAIALVVACGGTDDRNGTGPNEDDASASGGGSGSGGGNIFGAIPDGGFPLDALGGCASSTEHGAELPLDLYFMLDSSGSMDDLVSAGASKWSQVVKALSSFVDDTASAGIGVGLQYFPLNAAGVPASCTADSQCPASTGPCFFKACDLTMLNEVIPCASNADCLLSPGNGQPKVQFSCTAIGVCHNDFDTVCPINRVTDCGNDANNFPLGSCDAITTSTCSEGDSCAAQDYATPALPIALLPGAGAAIKTSLAAHAPNGNTPTSQALQGAIDEAKVFATANPGHSVVAVLATDGIPDECSPDDAAGIAQIAAAGLAGTPSVKTFVIGVFAPNDTTGGAPTVNQIAKAGGTKQAFIINTPAPGVDAGAADVETQFQAALNAIRDAALPCQYEVPLPDSGVPDFLAVNVEYTSSAGASTGLPYVETQASCGSGSGWYYDVDPANGATPSAINVCPGTCSTIQADKNGRVDVIVGCSTVTR
jgi:hypothetical protein